jgi:hypothetical protein
MDEAPDTAFVRIETGPDGGEVIRPNGSCRGPWDIDACHAGPPTGLIARAAERLLPDHRLVRLTVEVTRPIPFAGFTITGEVTRSGRSVATAALAIVDLDGRTVATAHSSHLAPRPADERIPLTMSPVTRLADARPGPFPLALTRHGQRAFMDGVEVRYPPGEDRLPGPTTLWMRTIPLVDGEEPSPFQRICPLADCGNALSRLAEPDTTGFVNTDLTIHLHRPPVGDWFGSRAESTWNADGIGLSDALLFDDRGPVGRALQTLLITPV